MDEAPTVDGRYRLTECVGSGRAATVWRARDQRLRRDVVLKVFGPDVPAGGPSRDVLGLMARMSNPGLAKVLDAGDDLEVDGECRVYVVGEPMSAPTLRAMVAAGPLPGEQVAAIGSSVAATLAYLHGHAVAHGGVTAHCIHVPVPERVFTGDPPPRCRTVLTDCAVDRLCGAAAGKPADDIRALASVLVEALLGRPAGGPAVALDELRAHGHDEWLTILGAMTADDPAARPSAAAVAAQLATLDVSEPAPDVAERVRRRRPRARHAQRRVQPWLGRRT